MHTEHNATPEELSGKSDRPPANTIVIMLREKILYNNIIPNAKIIYFIIICAYYKST